MFDPTAWRMIVEVITRCGIAVLLAAILGWEREMHGRPAGIRTHMLVALGTALFCQAGQALDGHSGRVAAQVVTGIGFLGAGTILRMGGEVKGLTTAASIWATAAIAMAASTGGPFLIIAAVGTLLALVTLSLMDVVIHRYMREHKNQGMEIIFSDRDGVFDVVELMGNAGFKILSIEVVKDGPHPEISLMLDHAEPNLLAQVIKLEGVRLARWAE